MYSVKQFSEKNIITKALKAIELLFAAIPFVSVKEIKKNITQKNVQLDIVLKVLISGKPAIFLIETKTHGEPRIIRTAAYQLDTYLKLFPRAYGIIVAPYLSDNSREVCKDMGIGCVDLAGNAYLSFGNMYIEKSGNPNPFTVARTSKSVFSPKSSRVLRVLLSNPEKKWYVDEISREANISIGLASRIKQALLAEEWIKEENKSFILAKPEEMLKQWVNNYSYTKNQRFSFYSGLSDVELESALHDVSSRKNIRYGLALFSGARKVAPFVKFLRFFAYIDGDISSIGDALQLKKVESGANVILLQPYDEGIWYGIQDIGGITVVSDLQLYLDLKSFKGRGEEAAQEIFEQRIKPTW